MKPGRRLKVLFHGVNEKKKNTGGEILKEDLIRRFWRCRCDVESQYDLQVGTWGKGEGR